MVFWSWITCQSLAARVLFLVTVKNQRASLAADEETLTPCNWRVERGEDPAFVKSCGAPKKPEFSTQRGLLCWNQDPNRVGVEPWDVEWDIWANVLRCTGNSRCPWNVWVCREAHPSLPLEVMSQHSTSPVLSWPADQELGLDHSHNQAGKGRTW